MEVLLEYLQLSCIGMGMASVDSQCQHPRIMQQKDVSLLLYRIINSSIFQ